MGDGKVRPYKVVVLNSQTGSRINTRYYADRKYALTTAVHACKRSYDPKYDSIPRDCYVYDGEKLIAAFEYYKSRFWYPSADESIEDVLAWIDGTVNRPKRHKRK